MCSNKKEYRDYLLCFMKMGDSYVPVPEVLTEEEAIVFLRLNENGPKNPHITLRYYREQGLLKGVHVGKRIRYPKKELLNFLDRLINND